MKRLFFILLVLVMGTGMAHATYKATLKLEMGNVNGGYVLASNSKQTNPSITATSSSANQTGGSIISPNDKGNVTLYAYAKADDGYEFIGWSKAKDGSGTIISDNPATLSLSAEHAALGRGDGTVHTYYAIFKKISYYMSISAVADESKGVAIATFSMDDIVTTSTSTSNTFTAYFVAEPAEGYAFTGWSEQAGGDIISEESFYEATLTSTSNDETQPTHKTLYANFDKAQVFRFRATAQSDGNGQALVSMGGKEYAASMEHTVESAGSSASTTAYFRAVPNEGFALDYWEDENGNHYAGAMCERHLTNDDVDGVAETTMTAHFVEATDPEPEPEPEEETAWSKYITIKDAVPFTLEFSVEGVTVTPKNQTEPWYLCTTTEQVNSSRWNNYEMRQFLGEGGYTEPSDKATWEWLLRDLAEQNDIHTGTQTISYKDLYLTDSGNFDFVVAHCNGCGWKTVTNDKGYTNLIIGETDAYRTSAFVIQNYDYERTFHFQVYVYGGSYTDDTETFNIIPDEAEQPYVYVIINEKDRNGRTDAEIWSEAVANTNAADFSKGVTTLVSSNYTPGTYRVIAGGVVQEDGSYVLYGDMLTRTWKIAGKESDKAKVTSVTVTVNATDNTIAVVPNEESGDYVAFLASKDQYTSADAARQDYINNWVSGGFFNGTQTIPMGKLKGYYGEGEYYLLVFGATSVEKNNENVFSQTQNTPYSTVVSITLGDMNADGKYSIADLVKVIGIIQNQSERSYYTSDNFQFNADMNADKAINSTDLELLIKKLYGTEKTGE